MYRKFILPKNLRGFYGRDQRLRLLNASPDAEMTRLPSPASALPEYLRPPVVEVAASVQFPTIRGLNAARIGLLWSRFRAQYPQTEQHPPLPKTVETFESARVGRIGFSIETSFLTPRIWFLSDDGTRLVQVQSNRLIVNWRQLETGTPYLRFAGLMSMLSEAINTLASFLDDEGLGRIEPDQVELTYVNHIRAGEKGSRRDSLSRFLACWASEPTEWDFGASEETSVRTQYVMKRPNGASARLFVELESAYTATTGAPIYIMNMIARGAPSAATVESSFEFFEDAHEWIVKGFTSLTTQEAHAIWGRQS